MRSRDGRADDGGRARDAARNPTNEPPVRLAVLADAHVTREATGSWKVYHRTEPHLRPAIADIEGRDVDAVLLAGDLTKDGAPTEFAAAD